MRKTICIVDFEATCWQDKRKTGPSGHGHVYPPMEIIEIGAVMADGKTLKKVGEFQAFVRPVREPVLSDFCTALTTIKQENVVRADTFPQVLAKWKVWMGTLSKKDDITFASWGAYDFKQLDKDCQYHKEEFPFLWDDHFNIKIHVADKMGWSRKGVGSAAQRLKLKFEGIAHRGIDDARMIHKILYKVGL